MLERAKLDALSKATEAIIGPPFAWCGVPSGSVQLEDASHYGLKHEGTSGGLFCIASFAIAQYPITNAQYQRFIDAENGQSNPDWWTFSKEAIQWREDRPEPRQTAFGGANVSRTRVSWFDSMAFCAWLSTELVHERDGEIGNKLDLQNADSWPVRLPTEQEWQRAAVGDTGWDYPWGNQLAEAHANYGNTMGRPINVGSYPSGQSPYGVMDLVGNLAEWCRTRWGEESNDVNDYVYRVTKGGAWNIANPEYLRAIDRNGWGPRGLLNDGGFRCTYHEAFAGDISPATPADIAEMAASFPDWGARQKHDERWQQQQQGNAVYLIARRQGQPVGHAYLKWQGATDAHVVERRTMPCPDIEDIFVLGDWRSHGIGTALIRKAENLAITQGFQHIGLSVGVENPTAQRLYERLGYQDAGFGEYTEQGTYLNAQDHTQIWEERCVYLLKKLTTA